MGHQVLKQQRVTLILIVLQIVSAIKLQVTIKSQAKNQRASSVMIKSVKTQPQLILL